MKRRAYIFEENPDLWDRIVRAANNADIDICGYVWEGSYTGGHYSSSTVICMNSAEVDHARRRLPAGYKILSAGQFLLTTDSVWYETYQSELARLTALR